MNDKDATQAFSGDDAEEKPAAGRAGDELAEALEAVAAANANEQQSGSYVYPDSGAASSQRFRLLPPDSKPAQWRQRHRAKLALIETILTGLFFLLTLYFLFLWLFP
ncbi:MAG: hypothetical protein LBS30_02860 [Planctomycetota bacterium]|jgi:hypothetical protein|nr:hypothetical protein [Planctomycetota bacterium]